MKTLTLIVLILTAMCCLQNCKPDPCKGIDRSPVTHNYSISDDDKSKIPYIGNDTLIFVSETGDTATLIGKGKKSYVETFPGGPVHDECQKKYTYNYDHVDLDFEGNNPSLYSIKYSLEGKSDRTNLNIFINNYSHGDYPYYLNTNIFYKDSILINHQYYYGTTLNLENMVNALYNHNYGFLSIQFVGGETWLKILNK